MHTRPQHYVTSKSTPYDLSTAIYTQGRYAHRRMTATPGECHFSERQVPPTSPTLLRTVLTSHLATHLISQQPHRGHPIICSYGRNRGMRYPGREPWASTSSGHLGLGFHSAVHMGEEMASSYSLVTWDTFPLPKYCRLRCGKS